MITKKHYSLILMAFTYFGIAILASCNGGSKLTPSEDFGAYYTKINSGEDEVVSLAKSWMHAPKIKNLKGAKGSYDAGQRAYVLKKTEDSISLTINASDESPIVNLGFVVKNWGDKPSAKMLLNGKEMKTKQGIIRDTDGTPTLNLWVEIQSSQSVDIQIVSELDI